GSVSVLMSPGQNFAFRSEIASRQHAGQVFSWKSFSHARGPAKCRIRREDSGGPDGRASRTRGARAAGTSPAREGGGDGPPPAAGTKAWTTARGPREAPPAAGGSSGRPPRRRARGLRRRR